MGFRSVGALELRWSRPSLQAPIGYAHGVPRPRSTLARASNALPLLLLIASTGACEEPPKGIDRVDPPVHRDDEVATDLRAEAYREALTAALEPARALLAAADPLAAYQAGLAPAASPPLRPSERRALQRQMEAARKEIDELDESYLPAAEVVILRTLRFAYARINDDLRRRARASRDPNHGLHTLDAYLAELRYRLIQDDCDEACEKLPHDLGEDLGGLRTSLSAASPASLAHAATRSRALASQTRELAARPLVSERVALGQSLTGLADALDEHATWLDQAATAVAAKPEPEQSWSDNPKPGQSNAPGELARLPDIVGEHITVRRMSVEDRIDLRPGPAYAEVERQVKRWKALRETLVAPRLAEAEPDVPAPVDQARCEAALTTLREGLAAIEEIDEPKLDCARYLGLLDDRARTEAELLLDLVDYGVIEPQRRALRSEELPELALISGQWSQSVHTHLRRIMILARLDHVHATALALDQGRQALCWSAANLWIHAQLGPASEVHLTLGEPCKELGDAETITTRVLGDPGATLAGFGLSLIGDEPARMVGFDRFFWAPLGLMKTLSTPRGMHPDRYTLPDEPEVVPPPEIRMQVEDL